MNNYHHPSRRSFSQLLFRVVSVVLCMLMSPVMQAASETHSLQLSEFQSAQDIGPDAAAAVVQANLQGKVLSVSSGSYNGRSVYRVKVLLSGGRVKVLQVLASNGRILD